MTTKSKDDAIRRIIKIKAKMDSTTFEEERKACQGGITALRRRWGVTDEDIEDYGTGEEHSFLGFTISADVDRQWKRYTRKKREVVDAILRLQAFLAEEPAWADERSFEEIEAQLEIAKQQAKRCEMCKDRGYGKEGLVQKFKNGKTPGGRQRFILLHKGCREDWVQLAQRHFQEHGRPMNAEDFGL